MLLASWLMSGSSVVKVPVSRIAEVATLPVRPVIVTVSVAVTETYRKP
jgi:hypothetical protein